MNSSVEVQPIGEPEREKWPDLAARLANIIAHYPVHQRGDLAQLRRMNPESPNAPAFWRLLHRHGLGRTQENERRWGTILQAIAIMTPNANTKDNVQSAHNPRRPFGRSLYEGNGKGRMPLCREGRLHQMLGSREHIFRRNFMIIMRMLAQNGAQVDWREAARLVLDEGRNLKAMEDHVRRVYRLYYQAEYHAENRDRDEGQQALAPETGGLSKNEEKNPMTIPTSEPDGRAELFKRMTASLREGAEEPIKPTRLTIPQLHLLITPEVQGLRYRIASQTRKIHGSLDD